MESFRIYIKPTAVKEIECLPKKYRLRIIAKVKTQAENPRPSGCEKLSGEVKYRIRRGSYRLVYSIQDGAREVLIVKVGHRKDVYR